MIFMETEKGALKTMTITEVSELYGLSRDTLRYYERVGMIPHVHRLQNGLRDYTEEDCRWVALAQCLRSAGLSVEAIVEYVQLCQEGEHTFCKRRDLLLEQRALLEEKKATIETAMAKLDKKIERYNHNMCCCKCS